ncbi:hypothetical protein P8452_21597 [Trifolium repens]|nr:hypothetical protein P8452_21597 [Trifolium repens]
MVTRIYQRKQHSRNSYVEFQLIHVNEEAARKVKAAAASRFKVHELGCEAMKAENEAAAAEDMKKELEELKRRCKKLKVSSYIKLFKGLLKKQSSQIKN